MGYTDYKTYNPTTPSLRGTVRVNRAGLWKGRPIKSLTSKLTKSGGRNNLGRITIWHRGGGSKNLYRLVDFKRNKIGIPATVERIEYDPNRSAYIALIRYEDGEISYILAWKGIQVGAQVIADEQADIKDGNRMSLKKLPIGTAIHDIELKPGKGGQLVRSAGASAKLASKDAGYANVKLTSGEIRRILLECRATIGAVSNPDHQNIKIGKAGANRWRGKKPVTRGVVMNPVDHPLGGGEGKTSGGRHPVTPWGKLTKGKRTRSNKATAKYIVQRRPRNSKKYKKGN